jgi:hypothetical protein
MHSKHLNKDDKVLIVPPGIYQQAIDTWHIHDDVHKTFLRCSFSLISKEYCSFCFNKARALLVFRDRLII